MISTSFLGTFIGIVKLKKLTIDSAVFRLHYRFTAGILLITSLVILALQYIISDPINCSQNYRINQQVLEDYCWTHPTFSVVSAFHKKVGSEVPYPGIDKSHNSQELVHHAYYQWVGFFLLGQAILFYLPRYFWKIAEGGKIKNIIEGFDNPLIKSEDKDVKKNIVIDYLATHSQFNRSYIIKYIVSEVLNFLNVVFQIYLVDTFLDGWFVMLGIIVIRHSLMEDNQRTDPMIMVFPRRTKCEYLTYGPSGDVEKHDASCMLPLNAINDKIFIAMWFWLLILAVVTAIMIIVVVAFVSCSAVRSSLLKSRCPLVKEGFINELSNSLTLGDWFIVYLMSKNMEAVRMYDLIVGLCQKVRGSQIPQHSIGCTAEKVNPKQLEACGFSKDIVIHEYPRLYGNGLTAV